MMVGYLQSSPTPSAYARVGINTRGACGDEASLGIEADNLARKNAETSLHGYDRVSRIFPRKGFCTFGTIVAFRG